jgi:uncharacterized membrane protein (DUF485 family)
MSDKLDSHDVVHSEAFLKDLMRRQLRLSLACLAAFLVVLLGLPLLNHSFPGVMAVRVFGFTLSWLVLGVCFFPAVWVIAWVFIRRSIALEEREAAAVRASR